jgi:hypothetical protein
MFPSIPGAYAAKSHKNYAKKVYFLPTENVKMKEYIGQNKK